MWGLNNEYYKPTALYGHYYLTRTLSRIFHIYLFRHRVSSTSPASIPRSKPAPIRVAPKPAMRTRKKGRNIFYDNRGLLDESNAYNHLLHNIDGRVVLCKKKFDAPALDQDDPKFNYTFSEADHGKRLKNELDLSLSHLSPKQGVWLAALIKQYWCVFDDRGTFVPVRHYRCILDTGSIAPIDVKKIHYGPQEIPIMHCSIAALEKVGQISQIHVAQWLFKALLAPKPHQEHISDITDFVWQFCMNYIPLNQVTRLIAYPTPCCDIVVETAFGGFWMWLYDAIMGYHQLSIAKEVCKKLAFQGPNAIK